MGDMGDIFRDMKEWQKTRRHIFGVKCPKCQEEQPKRQPTILEPGRICKVHRPWYRDPRPHPSEEEFDAKMKAYDWKRS